MLATAPIVQVSNGKDVSGIHYAFFHGTDAENDNKWMPNRNLYTEELAITAYRILTNDYQTLLQKNQTVTIPSYVNMYTIEAQFMVGAGVIPASAFNIEGLVKDKDYVLVGKVKNQIYATRNQIGFVLQKLFGSNYGISGTGFMSRLDYAKLLCMIQGRDLNPNYTYAVNQGKVLDRFPDDAGNPIIIEVSNTHDYMLDSHGNETWVENNTLK